MPTNYLRRSSKRASPRSPQLRTSGADRRLELTIGATRLLVMLDETASADLLLAALPLFSIAAPWGDTIHFEIPVYGGRDRTARINGEVGGLYYWAEEQRVLLVFGPTPISGNGEIRLPRPCNLLGRTTDDLSPLRKVHPGQKVSLKAL